MKKQNIIIKFINEHLRRLMVYGLIEREHKQIGEIKDLLKTAGKNFIRDNKTINRDVFELGDMFGVEIEKGKKAKQYRIKRNKNYDNVLKLILSLVLFKNNVNTIYDSNINKILNASNHPVEIISNLLIAIHGKIPVKMKYFSSSYNKELNFTLYPYEIIFKNGKWLILGFNPEINAFRQYQIQAVKNLELKLNEKFIKQDFDINKFYENTFKLFSNNDPALDYTIEINGCFSNSVLLDLPIDNYRVIEKKNHNIILAFKSKSELEVINWVFKYADKVKILKPDQVKKEYKAKLKNILNLY